MQTPARITGQTKDVQFQVGARKSFPIDLRTAWDFIISQQGINIWLFENANLNFTPGLIYKLPDGTSGRIRVFKPSSHLRLTWQPQNWDKPSTIQIRIIPSGKNTTIAFHQENIPGPVEREERKRFFLQVLDRIEEILPGL